MSRIRDEDEALLSLLEEGRKTSTKTKIADFRGNLELLTFQQQQQQQQQQAGRRTPGELLKKISSKFNKESAFIIDNGNRVPEAEDESITNGSDDESFSESEKVPAALLQANAKRTTTKRTRDERDEIGAFFKNKPALGGDQEKRGTFDPTVQPPKKSSTAPSPQQQQSPQASQPQVQQAPPVGGEDDALKSQRRKARQFSHSYSKVTHSKSFKKHDSDMQWQSFAATPEKSALFLISQEKYEGLLKDTHSEFSAEEGQFLRGTREEREERKAWRTLKREWLVNDEEYDRIEQLDDEEADLSCCDSEEEGNSGMQPKKVIYSKAGIGSSRKRVLSVFERTLAYMWMTTDVFSLMNWRSMGAFRPNLDTKDSNKDVILQLDILERMLVYSSESSDEAYYCDKIASHFNGSLRKWWNHRLLKRCLALQMEIRDLEAHQMDLNERMEGEIKGTFGFGFEDEIKRQELREDKIEELKNFLLRHAAPWAVEEVYHFRKQQMDPMKDRQKMARTCKEAYERLEESCLFFVRRDDVYPDGTPIVKPDPTNLKIMLQLTAEYRALTCWKPETSPYTNITTALQAGYVKNSKVEYDPYTNAIMTWESDDLGNHPTIEDDGESELEKSLKRRKIASGKPITVKKSQNIDNKGRKQACTAPGKGPSVQSTSISTYSTAKTVRRVDLNGGPAKLLATARNKRQIDASQFQTKRYPTDQFDSEVGDFF